MYLCYIDEAGCPGTLPSPESDVQPVLVVVALIVPEHVLPRLTREFLQLKAQFYRELARSSMFLDWVYVEIKGSELRKTATCRTRRSRRRTIGFLDKVLALLARLNCRIVGRAWIKQPRVKFNGRAVYSRSIQSIFEDFQHFLTAQNMRGFVIADARTKSLNVNVAHSIFTQKHKASGDAYERILEMPSFGHSDNHVGLQLTDLLASTFLYPFAIWSYCWGHISNVHVRAEYELMKSRFAPRVSSLQYRYINVGGCYRGGITVSDRNAMNLSHKSAPPRAL